MNNKIITLGVITVLFMGTTSLADVNMNLINPIVHKSPSTNVKCTSKSKFFGFLQVGLGFGDGATKVGEYKFDADRIRLGWKYFCGPMAAKVFLDFAKDGLDKNGIGVPESVKDAFIAYRFDKAFVLKAGVLKTPVGMSFTIPGWNLDVIKRGFDKKLAFERDFGVMLSGRDIGFGNNAKVNALEMGHERPWRGFGYDLMFAGQAGRSGGVVNAKSGNGEAYMGRLMFDWGEVLHTEVSYGISKDAGGTNGAKNVNNMLITTTDTQDYKVFNAGIDSHLDRGNLKAEYYNAINIRGVKGWDIWTIALTGTYYITDTLEFAIKDIRGTETKDKNDANAANTYIGLNYYIHPKNNKMDRKSKRGRNRQRVQINYVLSEVENTFQGLGSLYRDDAVLLQYQYKF